MDVLGQMGTGQCLSDAVIADVGDLAESVEQAECLEDAGINADADVGVPSFDSLQCRAGREGALGHDRHWQPSASTGIVYVRSKLAQGTPHGGRGGMWSGHFDTFTLQIG